MTNIYTTTPPHIRPHVPVQVAPVDDDSGGDLIVKGNPPTIIPHSPPVQSSPLVASSTVFQIAQVSSDDGDDKGGPVLQPDESPPFVPPLVTTPGTGSAPNVPTKGPYVGDIEDHSPPPTLDEDVDGDVPVFQPGESPPFVPPLVPPTSSDTPVKAPGVGVIEDHSPPVAQDDGGLTAAFSDSIQISNYDTKKQIADHSPPVADNGGTVVLNVPSSSQPISLTPSSETDLAINDNPIRISPHGPVDTTPVEGGQLYDPAIKGPANQNPPKLPPIVTTAPTDRMKQIKAAFDDKKVGTIAPHSPPVQTTFSDQMYKNALSLITDTSNSAIYTRAYQSGHISPLNVTA